MAPDPTPTPRDLRIFGLIMAAGLGVIGLLGFWKAGWEPTPARIALWSSGGAFLVVGLAWPRALRWPYTAWMAAGTFLGHIVSTVILTIFFFCFLTPVGLIRRLFGTDGLGLKARPEGVSYWKPKEADGRGVERYQNPF